MSWGNKVVNSKRNERVKCLRDDIQVLRSDSFNLINLHVIRHKPLSSTELCVRKGGLTFYKELKQAWNYLLVDYYYTTTLCGNHRF